MATNSTYDYSQRSAFWNVPTQRKASAETQNASAAEIIPGKRKTGLIAKSRLDQRSPKAKKKVGSHRKKRWLLHAGYVSIFEFDKRSPL
jgi:hypothetical protein